MCESIVVVGAALSADVDAPTERVHSAPGGRRGQSSGQHRVGNIVQASAWRCLSQWREHRMLANSDARSPQHGKHMRVALSNWS
jgi:hypothetical protein